MTDDVYVWRLPNRVIWISTAIVFGPLFLLQVYTVYVLWDFDGGRQLLWGLAIIGTAGLSGWLSSRTSPTVHFSQDEVRWPLGFKLRPEDVEYYKIVRRLGMEWVHIQRRKGLTYRPFINLPGGQEFRRRLLEWLGRTGPPR
jgi:hypothetical protein